MLRVVVSDGLPSQPSPGEDARRIVRHGLFDVLLWLGEDVGPVPGEGTHILQSGDTLYVSASVGEAIRSLSFSSTWSRQ